MARLVFLLAGQSNMAGRGSLAEVLNTDNAAAVHVCSSEKILSFHQTRDEFVPARHPLHNDKPEKAGVGPALSFAEGLITHYPPASKGGIALVPCAWGGSPLERWEEGGDLAAEAIRRTKAALSALRPTEKEGAGGAEGGTLAGILWHQGESNCGEPEASSSYGTRLEGALTSLRDALGSPEVPIIMGELGYFLPELAKDDGRFRFCPEVNGSILRTAKRLKKCECVSANKLDHRGDRLHFSSASQVKFGRRLAQAWLSLQSNDQCQEALVTEPHCFPESGRNDDDGDVPVHLNKKAKKSHQPAVMA